jgi:elongation factor Ts
MTVSAQEVMALRQRTGASMMACKKALVESSGDEEKAIDILMKKGEAKAAEKSDRTANEGVVAIAAGKGKAAVVKVNSETDFVARNEEFIGFAQDVAQIALDKGADAAKADGEEKLKALFTKLGENMSLAAVDVIEGAVVGSYTHTNNKIGVVTVLEGGTEEQAKDVSMHAAAMNPAVVSPEEVTQESVDRQKAIWTDQLKEEGKPAEIIDKIMMGKEKKFREEHALLTQPFVKDSEKTIAQYLGDAKVVQFVRIAV